MDIVLATPQAQTMGIFMPTGIPERSTRPDVAESSAGIATVWLVLYLVIAIVAFANPPNSGVFDIAAVVSP